MRPSVAYGAHSSVIVDMNPDKAYKRVVTSLQPQRTSIRIGEALYGFCTSQHSRLLLCSPSSLTLTTLTLTPNHSHPSLSPLTPLHPSLSSLDPPHSSTLSPIHFHHHPSLSHSPPPFNLTSHPSLSHLPPPFSLTSHPSLSFSLYFLSPLTLPFTPPLTACHSSHPLLPPTPLHPSLSLSSLTPPDLSLLPSLPPTPGSMQVDAVGELCPLSDSKTRLIPNQYRCDTPPPPCSRAI